MLNLEYRTSFKSSTFIATLLSLLFAGLSHGQSEMDFPYQALVLREGAKVHSGPGSVHYGTDSLEQGDVVEVHEHDPGGWCAIRPPEGSFSLIPQGAMNLVAKGVGQIKAGGTKAWVGTKLGPVENPLWQVKLKRGEMVEVIGQINWPQPEGHSTVWYQIAPPSGEFRWIQMSNIQLPAAARLKMQQESLNQASNNRASNNRLAQNVRVRPVTDFSTNDRITNETANETEVQQASLEVEINQDSYGESKNSGWRQATRPIRNRMLAQNGSSMNSQRGIGGQNRSTNLNRTSNMDSRNYDSSFGRSPDQRYAGESKAAEVPITPRNTGSYNRFADANLTPNNLARRLDSARLTGMGIPNQLNSSRTRMTDLEMSLSREMIKEPKNWKLDDLELQATTLFRTSTNMSERAAADKFISKIENCRKVKAGYQSGHDTAIGTGTGTGRHVGNSTLGSGTRSNLAHSTLGSGSRNVLGTDSLRSGMRNDVALGTTYDAHGWLNQLVRDGGQSQSEYVLQDANGKITHHVRAIQGMNLHRYLKSYVGIIGQRGYHNRLKLDHVTAHRVIELQKPRR